MKGQKHLTIVIKLGTSSIVDEKTHEPILSILTLIVETAVNLHKDGHKVIIVSSGAVGVGLRRMDIEKRPKHMPQIQALAAVGQCRLMSLWDSLFAHLRQPVAQILLTRNDIADRTQYLNAQNTFSELLNMGVIPIVNENDTIAVSEIKFGDNDTLSAITAAMVHADYLFLMTDVDCLYNKNPRTNPSAKPIEVITDISTLEADVSTAGSALGTGGMMTKIVAARLATSAGVTTIITKSSKPGNIYNIITYLQTIKTPPRSTSPPPPAPESSLPTTEVPNGDAPPKPSPATAIHPLHTRFLPSPIPIRNRQFWLLHGLAPHGTIYIDHGAYRALKNKHGLLPVGIIAVEGTFSQQEAVRIVVADRPLSHSHTSSHSNSHSHSRTPSSQVTAAAVPLMDDTTGSGRITPVPDFVDGYSNPSSRPRTPTTPFRPKTPTPASQDQPLKTHAEVGRALVNYSSTEIVRIKGLQSTEIGNVLGYADSEYVALRENVSLIGSGSGIEKEKERGNVEGGAAEEGEKERMGTLTDFA